MLRCKNNHKIFDNLHLEGYEESKQGRLEMKAEKAAAYPPSVRFSFLKERYFLIVNLSCIAVFYQFFFCFSQYIEVFTSDRSFYLGIFFKNSIIKAATKTAWLLRAMLW